MDEQLIRRFYSIWETAKVNSPLNQKSAVCVSTIDPSGFPQSRFVDLKDVTAHGFTFCTAYNSQKGLHLAENPKVSLIAWWDHIGYQIRVVGKALRISDELADTYWLTRSKEAQVATTCFKQSEEWEATMSPDEHFDSALATAPPSIKRPPLWGGLL